MAFKTISPRTLSCRKERLLLKAETWALGQRRWQAFHLKGQHVSLALICWEVRDIVFLEQCGHLETQKPPFPLKAAPPVHLLFCSSSFFKGTLRQAAF